MSDPATTPLDGERYISLETFRRDGTGVKTPVWAAPLDGRLVVMTDGTAYKVKRLRNDPRCRVAACDARGNVHGPWHDGRCRIFEDEGDRSRAHAALRSKYGWQFRMADPVSTLSRRIGRRVYFEVTL
jgi:PPOX class probable F420-dependent enzyme